MKICVGDNQYAEQFEFSNYLAEDKTIVKQKPLRLIELFAGYGSQSLALSYLGLPFEHWRISEWAIKSIQAYKDLHFENDCTDYSADKSLDEIKSWLLGRISSDYSNPLTEKQIARKSEKELRLIYNNMKTSNNLGSVTKISPEDLNIVDTDKFNYLLTYSFPCQDLSAAGQGKGMREGDGTRSGLVWEVGRLLKGLPEKPQFLLMENVPQILSKKHKPEFEKWLAVLGSMGYTSCYFTINAKDFGVAQNRKRVFCVSVLNNSAFNISPQGFVLENKLKNFLQKSVDESYYLKGKSLVYIQKRVGKYTQLLNPDVDNIALSAITAKGTQNWTGNFIIAKNEDTIEYGE